MPAVRARSVTRALPRTVLNAYGNRAGSVV